MDKNLLGYISLLWRFSYPLLLKRKQFPTKIKLKYNNFLKVYILLSWFTKVRPSAHLWNKTAKNIPSTLATSTSIPIANPSKVAWIPIATYKIYGAISLAYLFAKLICSSFNIIYCLVSLIISYSCRYSSSWLFYIFNL